MGLDSLYNDRSTLDHRFGNLSGSVGVSVESFPVIAPEVDDTGRIQRAINSLPNGGFVRFTLKTYTFNEIQVPNDYTYLVGQGRGTVFHPTTNNQYVIRFSSSNGGVLNVTIDANGKTGVTALAIVPLNESQTTTQVNQNYNLFMNLWIKNCTEGIKMATGPNVAGADSGCWYNEFHNIHLQYNTRGIWLKNGLSSPSNRNSFFGIRIGQTGVNTGLQIDSGAENLFFGLSFEGISSGTTPNATPTAIIIANLSSGGAGNNTNKFFGTTFESNTMDITNNNPYTEFYGGSPNLNKVNGSANPKYNVGGDPSQYPLILPGLIYSEGSMTTGVSQQGAWEFSKPINPKQGITPEAVSNPTLLNAWTNFDAGANSQVAYWKDPFGVVHLQGTVKGGTIGTAVFNLPAGYRPAGQQHFGVDSNNAYGVCRIATTGDVLADVGVNTRFSLNGINFRAGS